MDVTWTGESEPGRPYWWDGLPNLDCDAPLPARCDLLVIGAGYTGLSAAIAAADLGASVAVVDAETPGFGASTRNGGMFGAHPRLAWDKLAASFGPQTADALFAEARPAQDWVEALIAREGIDCALQRTGRIQLAWTRAQFAAQGRMAGTIAAKSQVRVRLVRREDLGAEIATERYFGGLIFEDHCGLHPALFHRGLLAALDRRRVPVTGGARVTGLERGLDGFVARTPKGTIRAQKVVLATNGYSTAPFRWHAQRVFPVPSYIIATEALSPDLIASLAPGGRMMVETRARHSYFRVSPDGTRILFGGRASMRQIDPVLAAARQKRTMCEIWPELRGVRLSHSWRGNTGFSFGQMPHVGGDRGLYHAMGYSGSGTVMAPWLGAKAAWAALGDARAETAYSLTQLRRSWLQPGTTPHFLGAADLWYRHWVDRSDNRGSR